jgi:hypothetical protein
MRIAATDRQIDPDKHSTSDGLETDRRGVGPDPPLVKEVPRLCRGGSKSLAFAASSIMRLSVSATMCGLISQYSATTPSPGPDMLSVLRKRLTVRGFIVWDFAARQADFLRDMSE